MPPSQGRIEEAIAHYQKFLQLRPGDAEAIATLEKLKRPGLSSKTRPVAKK